VQNTLECKPPGGGYLLVQKEIVNNTGVSIATLDGLTFAAVVTCNGNDTPLLLTRNTSKVVHNIPFNHVCTVVETLPPAPAGPCAIAGQVPTWVTPPTYTPASATVTPGPGKTIVVRNTLNCEPPGTNGNRKGVLTVSKTVVNNTGEPNAVAGLSFPMQISCAPPSGTATVTNVSLAGGGSSTLNTLAQGDTCTVNEPTPADISNACLAGAAWTVSYAPQNSALIGATPQTIAVTNTLNCKGKIGAPPPKTVCKRPLVPGVRPGTCVCPIGTTQKGATCVTQIVCRSPAKLNSRGTACECPRGMTVKGNSCVEQQVKPRVTPNDVIRVLPGVLGPGGFGGGGGDRPRDGGGGGAGGGGSGGYKPPGVR
jgi:hypothetical protein